MIYSIYRSEEREKLFQRCVDPVSTPTTLYFYKLQSRNDIKLKNINDAKRLIVGVPRGDYTMDLVKKMGFNKIEISNSFQHSVKKFIKRRFDILPAPEANLKYVLNELGVNKKKTVIAIQVFKNEVSKNYAAFSHGTSKEIINRVLEANE